MKNTLIFEHDGEISIQVILPGFDPYERALYSVPTGTPFWIVEEEQVAGLDYEYREAWELDYELLGEPDGYGE